MPKMSLLTPLWAFTQYKSQQQEDSWLRSCIVFAIETLIHLKLFNGSQYSCTYSNNKELNIWIIRLHSNYFTVKEKLVHSKVQNAFFVAVHQPANV